MENSLIESLRTSAINSSYESKIEFQQKLLSNKQEKMITIIRSIVTVKLLNSCKYQRISTI